MARPIQNSSNELTMIEEKHRKIWKQEQMTKRRSVSTNGRGSFSAKENHRSALDRGHLFIITLWFLLKLPLACVQESKELWPHLTSFHATLIYFMHTRSCFLILTKLNYKTLQDCRTLLGTAFTKWPHGSLKAPCSEERKEVNFIIDDKRKELLHLQALIIAHVLSVKHNCSY